MRQLAIFGAGGHGRVVAEIAELTGWIPVFFDDGWEAALPVNGELLIVNGRQSRKSENLKDGLSGEAVAEMEDRDQKSPILYRKSAVGNLEMLLARLNEFEACFVAIGNNAFRGEKQFLLKSKGASLATLIHPSAVVSKYALLGEGSVVMANAVVNAFASMGTGCIVNSGSIVEHDCQIGDFVLLDSNVTLGGGAQIGDLAWIKLGTTVDKQAVIAPDTMTIG